MKIQNDIDLAVASASSRRAKAWKNKTVRWSEILDRMSTTARTPETVAEYKKMSKDRQSEIKDVGAIVGGYCANGSRSDVTSRSIVALDADYAQPGLWDDFCMLYGAAAAVYSTHKHTPEAPRLRLMVPLAREVGPDEYQAVSRRIAADLGIDQFDDSTYQSQRCMFWPSTSVDGEFVFDYLDAPVLNPDAVLATFRDWRDISSWPMSSRVTEIVKRETSKQADPLEKTGLIGAFCRAYSIEEAIEAFIPVYSPCDEPGRYTYTEGSTAAGVIVYDGKFSYSFHATDPASGVLCNAWDLVRLHRFGAMDENVDPGQAPSKRPSYTAMTEFARNDARVKAQVVADKNVDFDELPEDAPGDGWVSKLKVTKDGSLASTIGNVVLILENDPAFKGKLHADEMAHNFITTAPVPWQKAPGVWSDSDDAALRFYLEQKYALSGKDKIFDAVNVVAERHSFHPVRDYLDGCRWDGVPRVDRLLVDYLGATDGEYTRAVTRKTLAAAVARVYRPGCKFDYMLVFRGRQGLGKSTLIRKLGRSWFTDSFSTLQGKDAYEQVLGAWLVEAGELAGMRKAEAEVIKLFISKQVDRFRPAYGRRTQEFPRQCVFFGTTNETQFLRDATGNRRFWIVDTPSEPSRSVWDDLTPAEVDLIWAEAVEIYRAGEELYLPGKLESTARKVQAAYEEDNPKVGIVLQYLERALPAGWDDLDLFARRTWLEGNEAGTVPRERVTSIEVWAEALGGNPERLDRYGIKEINDILSQLPEWHRMGDERVTVKPYGRQRYYRRVEE